MILLNCPHCGERNSQEFRYGGEYNPRPKDPSSVSQQEWTDFVYLRDNKLGVQKEWWYHRAGCQVWFLAERHTASLDVKKTYLWGAKDE
jgi:sarcosine oxidase subunit delta